MPEAQTDHDSLITLVETVKNIKDNQDRFHIEMKQSFSDLKNNYADRLDKLENRVRKVENKLIYYLGGGAVIGILIVACWQLLLAYFSKH